MKILRFDTCTSTNDVIRTQHDDMLLAVALGQTSGRGQRGNVWVSDYGKNLLFSISVLPVALLASDAFILSQVMALSVYAALSQSMPGRPLSIKWPNDIYVGNRKICGILIENDLQGKRVVRSILGCGINVNQTVFPEGLAVPATSVALELGHEVECDALLMSVSDSFRYYYSRLHSGELASLRQEYHSHLYMQGTVARFEDAGGIFLGTISHVENDGHLVIEDAEGVQHRYAFKEVKMIL